MAPVKEGTKKKTKKDTKPKEKKSPTCSVDGCDRNKHARGLCFMHYQRQRNTGSLELPDQYKNKGKGDKGKYAKGMTRNEYTRALRSGGDPSYKRKPPTV